MRWRCRVWGGRGGAALSVWGGIWLAAGEVWGVGGWALSGHCAHQRQRGACTCGRVASGGGGGGGALRRAALGVGRRVWGRASGEGLVGVGG